MDSQIFYAAFILACMARSKATSKAISNTISKAASKAISNTRSNTRSKAASKAVSKAASKAASDAASKATSDAGGRRTRQSGPLDEKGLVAGVVKEMALSVRKHGVYSQELLGDFTVGVRLAGGVRWCRVSELLALHNEEGDIRYRTPGDLSASFPVVDPASSVPLELEFGWQPAECFGRVLLKVYRDGVPAPRFWAANSARLTTCL